MTTSFLTYKNGLVIQASNSIMHVRALCKAEYIINLQELILVEFRPWEMNRSFGKSLQISGIFLSFCDFESKINVNIILQCRPKAIPLNGEVLGRLEGGNRVGKQNCSFETELCLPGCGGNAESICSQLGKERKMGALQRSCQEFMRLCKVHLFHGCQKWQRAEPQL